MSPLRGYSLHKSSFHHRSQLIPVSRSTLTGKILKRLIKVAKVIKAALVTYSGNAHLLFSKQFTGVYNAVFTNR